MRDLDLANPIRAFFDQHLVAQRGLSGHTVLAYRDAIKLLLGFASKHHRRTCSALTLKEIDAATVRGFLDYLERDRRNSVPTRNLRLAAIHSFFQYIATLDPRHLAQSQSILAVPFKRQAHRVPEYLERHEIQAIIRGISGSAPYASRDDAILRLLYNTGMRAQEIVDLDIEHVRFSRPQLVRIFGKGRKERTCPLWKETVGALRSYLEDRHVHVTDHLPLFVNGAGERLTRFGIRYIVSHRVGEAAKECPSLQSKRVTPHTLRHTTAMHLLQSGVDLSMIRSWLGHASIETTNTYVEIDLEMKRKTLNATEKLLPKKGRRLHSWANNNDILSWLSAL